MTDLAKLVVKLEAQTAQYSDALDRATKRLNKFDNEAKISAKSIAKGVGAAVVGAALGFAAMTREAINTADKMGEMAEASGVAVESLSQLQHAAKLGGTSFDQLYVGLTKLSKAAVESARGSDTARKAFAAIGVTVKDSNGKLKSTEDLLLDVAEQFSKYEDGAGKATLAMELFGKSGVELIPFLNKGRDGIKALMEEADRLGLTISDKAAAAAGEFNDNLDRISGSASGLANQAAQELLPMLSTLADNFATAATEGGAMDLTVKALAVTLKALVTAGVAVVSIFQQLGRVIYGGALAGLALLNKDFKGAMRAYKDAYVDIKKNVEADLETINKIWADHVEKTKESATELDSFMRKMDESIRKSIQGDPTSKRTLNFTDEKVADEQKKKAESALEQIQELERSMRQQVATYYSSEEAAMAYSIAQGELSVKFKEAGAAADPYKDKLIDLSQKLAELKKEAEDLSDFMANIDSEVKKWIDRDAQTIETTLEGLPQAEEQLSDFEKKARENLQDILAGGIEGMLEDGVKKGADGALQAFGDMLEKMAIQAVAAQLAEKIFGTGVSTPQVGGGMSSSGGWLGAAIDWISGAFGRDTGGRGRKGQAYMIGTGAQPEMFLPDTDGEFIPATAWGSMGGKLTQNIYVEGRVDQRSARQMALETARRQRIASMRLG